MDAASGAMYGFSANAPPAIGGSKAHSMLNANCSHDSLWSSFIMVTNLPGRRVRQGDKWLGPFSGQLDGSGAELRRMRTRHQGLLPEVLPPQRRCPSKRGMLSNDHERC